MGPSATELLRDRSRTYVKESFISYDELLKIHYTRVENMTGASRLQQHDNLHKQMAAFEKLTRHAMNRISGDTVYRMLQTISRGVPYVRGAKIVHKPLLPNNNRIVSFKQLRHLVATLNETKRKGIQKEEVDHVIKYFENLFKDVQYLKKLKRYFDERIYCCLYEYFYDPTDLDLLLCSSADETDTSRDNNFVDSGHSSMRSDADEPVTPAARRHYKKYSRVEKYSSVDAGDNSTATNEINDKKILFIAVKELNGVNKDWDAVLSEEEIDYRSFDKDSIHDLNQYKDYSHFEPVFRVVFDVFVKCHKSLELARTWWTQANIVYETPLAGVRTFENEYHRKISHLRSDILRLKDEIHKDEHALLVYENDLKTLQKREMRVDSLDKNCTDIVDRKTQAQRDYNSVVKRRETLKGEIENTVQGTSRYNDLCMQLRDTEVEMIEKYQQFKLLKYHFDILERDYHVELEVRPNFIRFTDHVQVKITDLTQKLKGKKIQRHDLEKSHELLRTNYEMMKDVVSRFIAAHPPTEAESDLNPDESKPDVSHDESEPDSDRKEPGQNPEPTPVVVSDKASVGGEKPSFFLTQAEPSALTQSSGDDNEANDADVDDDEDDVGNTVWTKKRTEPQRKLFDHSKPLGQQDYFVSKKKT